MSEALPDPLVPADTDIRDLDGFMLNVERLLASELWALSSGEEFKAAVALWCRAWKQFPAGSLPDDDKVLAAFSGAGSRWRKVRDVALRGFVKCSDGRLYHKVLCEDVLRAAAKKAERRERTKAATEARLRQRDEQRNDSRDDSSAHSRDGPRYVDRDVHVTTSQRQGQGQKKGSEAKASATAAPIADERERLFGPTLTAFIRFTGKPEPGSRALLGRWLKRCGDDCRAINDLVASAIAENRADPVAWIEAHLKPRAGGNGRAFTEETPEEFAGRHAEQDRRAIEEHWQYYADTYNLNGIWPVMTPKNPVTGAAEKRLSLDMVPPEHREKFIGPGKH